MDADTIVVIPPGLSFTPRAKSVHNFLYFWFTLGPIWDQCRTAPILYPLQDTTRQLLRKIAEHFAARGDPSHQEAVAILGLIGIILTKIDETSWSPRTKDPIILAILNNLYQDPLHAPDNQSMADNAGLHLASFLRRFRLQTGTSPERLRRQLRLNLAARLLHEGTPVKMVAKHCGWTDRSRFTTTFRKQFGIGPGAWSRQART